jgi:diguanylate cyclase (GGDEF)-like protein
VLVRNVRDVDVVSRYGGEEFVILLLQTDEQAAFRIAETIRHDLQSQSFDAGHRELNCTASFGVATFPSDATSAQQLMRKADERLYKAKQAGRNRVWGKT